MEQLSVLMKFIGCAVVTLVGMVLIPLGVCTCIKTDHDFIGSILTFFWIVEWICATVFLYNTVFGG